MAFTFGAPAASTATSTAAAAPTAPAAFSFGAKPAAPAPSTTGGTGLFGQPASQQPASTSTTTGSLFGAASTASTAPAQPASSGFSLFGAKPATTSAPAGTLGTSLFGSTQPAPAPAATTGGLFGGGASTSTSAAQPASTSLFGQPQQQQQQQQQQQTAQQQQQQQAILSPSSQLRKLGSPLSPQLSYIYDSWNLSNPSTCSFLYYFYNNVGVDAVQALLAQVGGGGWGSMRMMEVLRRRDALGAVNDALWEAAVRGNPDPTRLVPVLAVGFPDLAKRRAAQQAESDRIASTLSACSKRTDELLKSHTLGNTARLESTQRRQVVLHARILGLARRYWRLLEGGKSGLVQGGLGGVPSSSSPSSGGGGGFGASTSGTGGGAGAESAEWQRQDERTREVLEACNAIVNGSGPGSGSGSGGGGLEMSAWNGQGGGEGGGGPPLAAKLAELWPKVANLSARRAAKAAASGNGGGGTNSAQQSGGGWAVVDQEGVEEVAQILASQQAGLAHLTQTLNQDRAIVSALGEMLKGVRIVAN
ncbi:hypothetical protein CF319_g1355 [Tilletia indica]|nr:hypothetical protein CF319_g1355 [Tilletia indica]